MNDHALNRECQAFSIYLVKQQPNEYVMAKYREAHNASGIVARNEGGFLDRLLVGVAAAHPIGARLVDAYTAIFYKKSSVRRKWILLLAILESCAPTYKYFDVPDGGGRGWLAFRLLWQGLSFILAFGLSIILFMPAHLIHAAYHKQESRNY
ncbi:MAG: hypothetical protein AB7U82_01335 [Blastocatellales bacterium]